MGLFDLKVRGDSSAMPDAANAYFCEANARIDAFQAARSMPAFVPSDFFGAYQTLRALAAANLATGPAFCEWGSGFGAVTGAAALLDFDAVGIEVDDELVGAARDLAEDFHLTAEFHCGSFLPTGSEIHVETACTNSGNGFAWLSMEAGSPEEHDGPKVDDFDVVYCFPWPDEEGLIVDVFAEYAAADSLLVTFHGGEGFRIRRKTSRRSQSKMKSR